VSIEKGRTVKSIGHALWEQELAEYMSLHPDLDNLPPPVFPRRRSRLGGEYGCTGRRAGLAEPNAEHYAGSGVAKDHCSVTR
jgi:hypothetical protein